MELVTGREKGDDKEGVVPEHCGLDPAQAKQVQKIVSFGNCIFVKMDVFNKPEASDK